MDAERGPTGLGVDPAALGEADAAIFLDVERRRIFQQVSDVAVKREPGRRKRPNADRAGGVQPIDIAAPRRGDGDAELGHVALQRREPCVVGRTAVAQQAAAFAHGAFVIAEPRGVAAVEPVDQPVEKAAPSRGGIREQPIHLRRQPSHREVFAERRLARCVRAVDADDSAPDVAGPGCREPGSDIDLDRAGLQRRRDGPRRRIVAGPGAPTDFGKPRAAQPAPRREKRHRLQEVGLAGAVGAAQHHRTVVEIEAER